MYQWCVHQYPAHVHVPVPGSKDGGGLLGGVRVVAGQSLDADNEARGVNHVRGLRSVVVHEDVEIGWLLRQPLDAYRLPNLERHVRTKGTKQTNK